MTGLIGGAGHCVGMCGPLVAGYAIALRNRSATLPHLLFHMGRVTTYGIAGGVVGATGSFVRVAAWVAPLQSFLLAATGVLIALMGLSVGGWLPWARRIEGTVPFGGALAGIARRAAEAGGPGAAFPLGMATGLLPCGLVYTALLSAARSGMEARSPAEGFLRGSLAMVAFGAGTFPALFLFGRVVAAAGPRLRGALAKVAAALLVAAGVMFAARAFLR
ncbi:sulfite exporter TauE/SafE family protein [Candidatus Deferrimicrobium sp.]|uniref:sulfite exporter TauE/SafE family protein n=1 Tax=Candidatus Deferrimicrobium sp. TaxID=3060586 RepID=UPI00272449DD|nr:sulfite exporter TauE/SafE family protein [Candidatus Deferrimicrobium sp.]MDO8738912.1 sulfite exporter TauE/SafE family protein [Candidatus Deferrimicrobium sp.]